MNFKKIEDSFNWIIAECKACGSKIETDDKAEAEIGKNLDEAYIIQRVTRLLNTMAKCCLHADWSIKRN